MGNAKRWQPEDKLVQAALTQLVEAFDGSAREVARRSGLDQARLRTILAGTRAPASVGEAFRIVEAVGRQTSDIIGTIEQTAADYRFTSSEDGAPLTIELTWPSGPDTDESSLNPT
jgi:transcriptional regulator with XRE-family HTH domain